MLHPFQKGLLLKQLNHKINNGSISIKVQEKRSQFANRQLAIAKLISLLREKLKGDPKIRKATKPTKASQRKRVELKKKRGQLKKIDNLNLQNTYHS